MSERVDESKRWLSTFNMPIPDTNPVAIARAQQRPEGKGIFGKMFGMFSRRPGINTQTGAASVETDPDVPADGGGNGEFTINPQVVDPEK